MLVSRAVPYRAGTSLITRCMSSTGEAREALEIVEEGERKGLDRNRDGTIKLRFYIASPDELHTVNKLLYATYYPDEPLIKHLGLYNNQGIKDYDTRVEERLALNLSLLAYDETGRPVGAAVNNINTRVCDSLEKDLGKIEDPKFRPIHGIKYQLRKENDSVYDEIGIQKMFNIGMIGVEPMGLGCGIATNLMRRSILLAGCLGFRGIKTEATSRSSKEMFETVGLQASGSINYKDWTFEGAKPFAGMEGESTDIYFMKKKFFQSSLKHIL